MKSPGRASQNAFNLSLLEALSETFSCLHFQMTTNDNKPIKTNPGSIPAAKVFDTGTSVKALKSMAAFDGGIRASRKAADAAKTITNGFG